MNHSPLRVLIVEDNRADAELLNEYITETGIEVKITILDDRQRAFDQFQNAIDKTDEMPDLVLMDLNLPKRSGHEVLDFIRQYDNQVKVFIYSGSQSPDDVGKARSNKADGYLVKPMTVEEIEDVVKRLGNILNGCRK